MVLGDRPVGITVARMWASLGLWDRCRLVAQLLFNGLHMPTKEEMEALLKELVVCVYSGVQRNGGMCV